MKRTPLLFAALVPFAATAEQGGAQAIDYSELENDLQATSLIGTNVTAADGSEIGSIEDVLINTDGSASVIIQREGEFGVAEAGIADDLGETVEEAGVAVERGAEQVVETTEAVLDDDENAQVADASAETEGMDQGLDADRAGSTEMGDAFVQVEWGDIQYDAEEDVAILTGMRAAQPVAYEQTAEIDLQRRGARSSMLIGMEVNLADEDSFGEVEDVMVDPETGKASALVIDSMEFFDKERYAVPVDLNVIDPEEEELTLQYSQDQLEQMGEFEMEEATNEK